MSTGPEVTRADSPRVFICYRREETAAHAGRLYDAMVARFGESNVFMDIDLAPGVDFVDRITEVVAECQVLIVVMGPRWATVEDDEGQLRIADPEDFVRLEVETALRHPDVTPIPVLVSGARMPRRDNLPTEIQAITRRNALDLSEARWRYDVGRLNSRLDYLLADHPALPGRPAPEEGVAGGEAAVAAATVQEASPAASAPEAPPPAAEPGAPPAPERRRRSRPRWMWVLAVLAGAAAIAIVVVLVAGGGSGGGSGGESGGGGTTVGTGIPIGKKPVPIIVANQGIWVASRNSGTVTHLRSDGSKVRTVSVGADTKPSGLVFGGGKIWVALAGTGSVIPINPTSNQAGDSIQVGPDPRAVGFGHGIVWVANKDSGTVSRLDQDGNEVGPAIPVGGGPRAVTVGQGGVWVSNGDDGSVSEISPDSQRVVNTIQLGKSADPKGSAIADGKLWVADEGDRSVTPIDIQGPKREDPIPVGTDPRDVTFSNDTQRLYVSNGGDNSISVIDPATSKVDGPAIRLPDGSAPENVAAGFGKVWVAAGGTGKVIPLTP